MLETELEKQIENKFINAGWDVVEDKGVKAYRPDIVLSYQNHVMGYVEVMMYKEGNERCGLALDMYCKRVVDYIAMYYVELGGADAIVFTAGLGENAGYVKEQICKRLEVIGVKIDNSKAEIRGEEIELSTPESKIKVFVVPTNEELMMAEDTYNIVFNK